MVGIECRDHGLHLQQPIVAEGDVAPSLGRPGYRDAYADFASLTRSTGNSDKTIEWADGNTYPVIDVETPSASHPFRTGRQRLLDTADRAQKFRTNTPATTADPCWSGAVDPVPLIMKLAQGPAPETVVNFMVNVFGGGGVGGEV
jgi:large subunit ribosomal protein L31